QRLNLTEAEADNRCKALIANARRFGGVLTLLWHDRSHGPERFWGEFYARLVQSLKTCETWFASAGQAVGWFPKRRQGRFERCSTVGQSCAQLRYDGEEIGPELKIRIYPAGRGQATDIAWNGRFKDGLQDLINSRLAPATSDAALSSHS